MTIDKIENSKIIGTMTKEDADCFIKNGLAKGIDDHGIMKEEKCQYCEKRKELKSCNFCGRATMRICGKYMDIYGDEKKFNIFKRIYQPRFKINYCPMCGRKLGE